MGLLSRARHVGFRRTPAQDSPASGRRGLLTRAGMVRRARAQSPGPVDDPSPETGSLRQLERQSFNLSNLMEISREINGTLRLDDLCTIIILTVMGQSGAQKAVLYVRDDEEYVVRAARGLAEGLVLPSLPVDPVFAQTAVQRDGVFPVSACAFVDGSLETRLVSLLSGKLVVPFVNKGQCLAFLLLGERYPDQDWNEDEIGFLASIADMGSMALANARLFGELEKKLGQLSGLYEISRVINGSSEVGEILRLAGETLGTGFGVNRAVFLGLAGHDLVFLSGIGIEGIRAGSTMTPLFESVFTLEQALVIEDRSGNPELSAVFGEGVLEESNMALLVPLVAAGERVGILAVLGVEGRRSGTVLQEECELFSIIGSQFAPPLLVARTLGDKKRSLADPFHPWMELLEREVARAGEFGLSVGVCELSLDGIDERDGDMVRDLGRVLRDRIDLRYPVVRLAAASWAVVLSGLSLRDQERLIDSVTQEILTLLDRSGDAERIRLERSHGQIPEEYPSAAAWVFRRL